MHIPVFKPGDKILITGLIAIAVLLMAWHNLAPGSSGQLTAVITHNGNLVKRINLNALPRPEYVNLEEEGIHQVIKAEKGQIRFLQSDCPHKYCVKTGWLRKPGDRAVCIPSRVVITIVGDNKKADTLAY